MATGYLIKTKGLFEEIRETLGMSWNDKNYQLYFPREGILMGYFSDETFTSSKTRFVKKVHEGKLKSSLDDRIFKMKIWDSIDVDLLMLNNLKNSYSVLKDFENNFKKSFDIISKTKFQK